MLVVAKRVTFERLAHAIAFATACAACTHCAHDRSATVHLVVHRLGHCSWTLCMNIVLGHC